MARYSDHFLEAVKILRKDFILPALHPAMVAQWILESNRGHSDLAKKLNNFAGMKWRKELEGIAQPESIKVPSEPGPVDFCRFRSPEYFVRGFYRFLDRSPYAGWKDCKTPEEYIEHIGKTWATDPAYIAKVKALFPEAKELLEAPLGNNAFADTTWVCLFKGALEQHAGGLFAVGYNGAKPLFVTKINTTKQLAALYDAVGLHNVEVASPNMLIPSVPLVNLESVKELPKPSKPAGSLAGKKIFIEAGHGWSGENYDPGAVGHVVEWRQNTIIARSCAEELRRLGAIVILELYDNGTPPRDLMTRGRMAGSSDVFLSFHHNAFNDQAQGTETLYDRLADSNDISLAETIQKHLMTASPFRDRGVKRQGLGVLRGAKPGARAACLVEAYFVDGPGLRDVDELDRRMGIAAAAGIAEFLGAK